jgi:hypothetical protein
MKPLILLSIIVWLTACGHISPTHSVSGQESSEKKFSRARDPVEERESQRDLDASIVEARRRSYEKQGFSPEEARARAEIEYSGGGKR